MSVHSPVAKPMRAATTLPPSTVFEAAGVESGLARSSRGRRPGAHRESGATPWRTGMREIVLFITFGLVVVYRPAHLGARA